MTIRDDVLAALDREAPRSRQSVCDELGIDEKQCGNALNQLRLMNAATRVAEGWIRCDADVTARTEPAPAPAPRVEPSAAVIAAAPKLMRSLPGPSTTPAAPIPEKRSHKKTPKAVARKKPAKVEPVAPVSRGNALIKVVNGALSFALTEAREIAIERRDGSGQRAFISRDDALRLADFIQLVRPALVDA